MSTYSIFNISILPAWHAFGDDVVFIFWIFGFWLHRFVPLSSFWCICLFFRCCCCPIRVVDFTFFLKLNNFRPGIMNETANSAVCKKKELFKLIFALHEYSEASFFWPNYSPVPHDTQYINMILIYAIFKPRNRKPFKAFQMCYRIISTDTNVKNEMKFRRKTVEKPKMRKKSGAFWWKRILISWWNWF